MYWICALILPRCTQESVVIYGHLLRYCEGAKYWYWLGNRPTAKVHIGICIAILIKNLYWYWYWQYFFEAVLVLVLPILCKSIVNNPAYITRTRAHTLYNSLALQSLLHAIQRHIPKCEQGAGCVPIAEIVCVRPRLLLPLLITSCVFSLKICHCHKGAN